MLKNCGICAMGFFQITKLDLSGEPGIFPSNEMLYTAQQV
jgi:hypothetical protein